MQKSHERLLHNIFSLYLIQALNYLSPFLLYGFLNRTIGTTNFGMFMYAQSSLNLIVFFTDYGFNISALRKVSMLKTHEQLSRLYFSILGCKLIIALLIYLLLIIAFECSVVQRQLFSLLSVGVLMVLGNIFTPLWLYQGMQKMSYLSLSSIITKLLPLVFILYLVHNKNQLFTVQFLICGGWFISGLITFWGAIYLFRIKLVVPAYKELIAEYKDGLQVFLASGCGSFYSYGTTIILGWFTSYSVVGAYSIAERVAKGLVSIFQPFTQAVFPHVLAKISLKENLNGVITKSLFIVSGLGLIACLLMAATAPLIVQLLLGHHSYISQISIYYWSVTAFFIIQSIFLGPLLYALKLDKLLLKVFAICALLFIFSDLWLTKLWDYQGTCIAIMFNEMLICAAFTLILLRYRHVQLGLA